MITWQSVAKTNAIGTWNESHAVNPFIGGCIGNSMVFPIPLWQCPPTRELHLLRICSMIFPFRMGQVALESPRNTQITGVLGRGHLFIPLSECGNGSFLSDVGELLGEAKDRLYHSHRFKRHGKSHGLWLNYHVPMKIGIDWGTSPPFFGPNTSGLGWFPISYLTRPRRKCVGLLLPHAQAINQPPSHFSGWFLEYNEDIYIYTYNLFIYSSIYLSIYLYIFIYGDNEIPHRWCWIPCWP